jgi:hypothetical protein
VIPGTGVISEMAIEGGEPNYGDSGGSRTNSMVQFVSHVAPRSSEKACSQRGEPVRVWDQVTRIQIGLSSRVSSE